MVWIWFRKRSPFLFSSFNRIDIPPYEHYDKLYDKLLTAIEETCGFAVEWVADASGAQQQPEATWFGRDEPPPSPPTNQSIQTGVIHGCFT